MSSVKYPEFPARRSSKKKKKKGFEILLQELATENFQLPLKESEMEPPAVGDYDSTFILTAVSLTRRLRVEFRCHLKSRNPFACPGNTQCCSFTYRRTRRRSPQGFILVSSHPTSLQRCSCTAGDAGGWFACLFLNASI